MDEEEGELRKMKLSGWLFLLVSWGFIIGLTIFCFYKIFTKKKVD